jgi:flavin reductase (DIM6/NTAB) family NADH-FMN oxidoreductase RutF
VSEPTEPAAIGIREFWQAIGQRAIGSTIVAARSADGPAGLLGLSATHLCADPPTMLVCVDKRTSALNTILGARQFALSYLPHDAVELANIFAGKTDLKGPRRFGTATWTTLVTGSPVLESAVGAIDCQLLETIERYGVMILLGRVVATVGNPGRRPLIHYRGEYLS